MTNDTCPANTVDEHAARVVAGLVVVIVLLSATIPDAWWLMPVLAIDFALRAWVNRRYSPLRWIAKRLLGAFGMAPKHVYAPPKRFAAQIGSVLTTAVAVLHISSLHEAAVALSSVLAIAASLEAFLGICIACWMYPLVFKSRAA